MHMWNSKKKVRCFLSFWTASNSNSFNLTRHCRTLIVFLVGFHLLFFEIMGEAACFCLMQLSGYTCIKNELSFVLKHFEAEWIMLAKEKKWCRH